MTGGAFKFSLVLCTVGRVEPIAAFCASLLRQDRNDYELILVDQNADDRLSGIVAEYASKFPLRHVKSDTRGLSRARNVGLRYAGGGLVGFPDDDCEYFDGTLDCVAGLFDAEPALDGITGYPTAAATRTQPADWNAGTMELSAVTVLNRCQEFTIFLRREAVGAIRFNDHLGVGAGTPWGADEGPDFLIRVIQAGARLVFYPRLFVYHPDKVADVTPELIRRAASYARGRGALFRLHKFPASDVLRGLVRTAGGVAVYAAKCDFARSKYYRAVLGGMLRGLCMSRRELDALRRVPHLSAGPAAVPESVGVHA